MTADVNADSIAASKTDQRLLFGLLVAVAFVIRAVHILAISNLDINPLFARPIMDAGMHDDWARGILAGTWPGSEPFFRSPLYMYFLAGLYAVFGADQQLAVRLVHALVSALGAGLIGLSANRLWGRGAGWLAGLIYCGLWTSIYFAGELLIVSLTTTLNLLMLWLLLPAGWQGARPGGRRLLLVGLVWGLSAIGRPNILILGPVIGWYLYRHAGVGLRWRSWLALAVGLVLPILPVTAHNIVRGHDVVLIASQGGVNFFIGNNPEADGRTAWVPGTRPTWKGGFDDVQAIAVAEAGRPLKPSQIDRHYFFKGLAFWRDHPGTALRLYAHKLRLLLAAGERSNNKSLYFWRDRSWLLRWPVWLGWAPVLALAVLGLFRRDLQPGGRFLLLGCAALYSVSILLFFVNARFRLPVSAFLAIPAGGGLMQLIAFLRTRSWPDPRRGPIVALLLLAFSIVPDRASFTEDQLQLDVFSWHTLGNNYAAAGRLDEARDAYQRALSINERYPQPYFSWIENSLYTSLGDILKQQGRAAEVLRLYRRWVQSSPQNVDARVMLGDFLLQNGQTDEAAAHMEIALRNDPNHFGARLGQAWILYHNEDFGAALHRFQQLHREQNNVLALFGSGLCLIQLERWAEAEAAFKQVLVLQPTYWQALGNLAGLYEQTGRVEDARRTYEQLLRFNPQDARAQAYLRQHTASPR